MRGSVRKRENRRAWLEREVSSTLTGCERATMSPERENSGRTQGSRDRIYWKSWGSLRVGCGGTGSPPELRAVPWSSPPALHRVPTNTDINCIPDP